MAKTANQANQITDLLRNKAELRATIAALKTERNEREKQIAKLTARVAELEHLLAANRLETEADRRVRDMRRELDRRNRIIAELRSLSGIRPATLEASQRDVTA